MRAVFAVDKCYLMVQLLTVMMVVTRVAAMVVMTVVTRVAAMVVMTVERRGIQCRSYRDGRKRCR